MAFSRSSLFGITTLAVGILGIGGPIGWDYYKTKSAIEIRLLESNVVIEKPQKLAGLVVTYGGEEVQELSKSLIAVTNTGRTPILNRDIVQPISFRFHPESKLLDARIETTTPQDLGATISLNRKDGLVVVNVPLLNPGDVVQISALASSLKPAFIVSGRIAGVSSLTFIQDLLQVPVVKTTPWTVYPVAFFSLLLFLIGIYALIFSLPGELRVKKALKRNTFQVPNLDSKAACLAWIEKYFTFMTRSDRGLLQGSVSMLPEAANFALTHQQKILSAIRVHVEQHVSNFVVSAMTLAVVAVGALYVLGNV